MSYVELVIQVRSDNANAILEHHHYHIYTPSPCNFALARLLELTDFIRRTGVHAFTNDPKKPCSLCYTLGKEQSRDPRRSKKPQAR